MAELNVLTNLQTRLKSQLTVATGGQPLTSEQIAVIVRQVMESLEGDVSSGDLKFYSELVDLARYIRDAKHEIASLAPKYISTDFIPSATDELDAVVGATEEATNKIMDVCDEISALAETVGGEAKDKMIACTTKIFEACNFQDITGQRITKVVQTLKHIDSKIGAIVQAMGDGIQNATGDGRLPSHLQGNDPEKGLLNGPQLPGNAVSQEDIDRLLSGS